MLHGLNTNPTADQTPSTCRLYVHWAVLLLIQWFNSISWDLEAIKSSAVC